ncbi:MAG: hypothetical protein OEQ25_07175 [Gammaproteobacteria bacterium]|nr:hypothetical protein [Gammaproteobacteria bacterium]MDH3506907.1 hypothetical protein [Gammaproteobacteria bacterium]
MKSVAYVIALSTIVTGVAMAQPPDVSERMDRMDRMAILLDLDEFQKTEVQRILQAQRETARASREAMREAGERPSREERMAHRQQAREAVLTQLQSVLTQDQLTKFEVLAADERRGRGRRDGGRRGQDSVEE